MFIDLKRAFETIPHSPFLDKLHSLGFRGQSTNLIKLNCTLKADCHKEQKQNSGHLYTLRLPAADPHIPLDNTNRIQYRMNPMLPATKRRPGDLFLLPRRESLAGSHDVCKCAELCSCFCYL